MFEHADAAGAPTMITMREMGNGVLKIIWWFATEIQSGVAKEDGEKEFEAILVDFDEARGKLRFASDREVFEEMRRVCQIASDGA